MSNKMETWNQVKQFYKDKFDLEPNMVELATNFDILKMCATGASNKTIADFLEIDEELVSAVIDKYLEFSGWEFDLPTNPMKLYNAGEVEFTAKNICEQFSVLERLLNEKWI